MNKFKKILLGVASVLTLGALFTVTGVKIAAATISAEFSANDLDADGTQIQADTSTPFYENALFSLNMTGTGAYVSTIGGEEYDGSRKYSTIEGFTATANDGSGKTYTQAVLPTASTQPSNNVDRGINLTAKDNKIDVTIYFTCTDGVFPYTTNKDGKSQGASYGKSGDIVVNGETISTVSGNKSRNVAYAANAEVPANTTVLIESTSNRLALFGIVASYEAADEGQTSITFKDGTSDLDTIVYDDGDTIDYVPSKTHYTFNGWYTDSDLAENHKLADNYTVDGTITILYAKFTEDAKYTISYYIDGVLDKTENNVYVGTSINYSPTFDDYGFDGWYSDSNCSQAIASNYTVNSNASLYGKKVALANYLDSTNMSVHSGGAVNHYNNTIFNFVDKGTEIQVEANTGVVLPNGERCAYRINKANSSAVDNRLITFKAPFNGTVKVWAAAGNADKNFYICDTTYSATSYIANQAKPAKNELFELTADIVSGKTYAIGGDSRFYIYGIFVEEAPEVEVTPLVQEATDTDYTYVRFVTIVSNAGEISSNDVEFSITMTYTNETTKTVSYTPYVVKKITQNGEAYVANVGTESHTFDNALNATEYYVVYVIRFTTSKFAGCKVSATTTFAGQEYTSSQVTI